MRAAEMQKLTYIDSECAVAPRISPITADRIADQEVLERLVYPMVNEGAKLVEEGIVERASDIDVVWHYGFGWPTWKGGPMYYADQVGAATVSRRLQELAAQHGDFFQPAALLQDMATSGRSFTA
jgi:3-hydroxyacyl-CoA dehydrogenase